MADENKKAVYFYQVSESGTIVCTNNPMKLIKSKINGKDVLSRTQSELSFGLLCLVDVDPETGEQTTAHGSELGLKRGDAIPNFRFSSNPVIDRDSGEETGMYWIEAC